MKTNKKKFFSGGFLYNPKNSCILLHQRDGNTTFNPYAWAFFGGLNEGDENEIECFQRELEEEIGLKVKIKDIIYLDDYLNEEFNTHRYIYYVISDVKIEDLNLGEGAGFGWININNLDKVKLTEKTERDLKTFQKKVLKDG